MNENEPEFAELWGFETTALLTSNDSEGEEDNRDDKELFTRWKYTKTEAGRVHFKHIDELVAEFLKVKKM